MLAKWRAGTTELIEEKEGRGRVLTCLELADLPFEALVEFYREEPDENAAEDPQ